MKPPPDLNPHAAKKVLKVFLDADLRHQLTGASYCECIEQQAWKHIGQARRVLLQVAWLGETGAKAWMDYFIEGMTE